MEKFMPKATAVKEQNPDDMERTMAINQRRIFQGGAGTLAGLWFSSWHRINRCSKPQAFSTSIRVVTIKPDGNSRI
jgi:hypothetical protein